MKTFKILMASLLIATQVNAAVIGNNIAREIPQQVVVSATAASYTLGAVTFQDTGDTVTLNAHNLSAGEVVRFGTITTTTGISINTDYYVVNPTTNTFQVAAAPGGSALALTTNGTGVLSSSYYAVVHAQVRNGGTFSVNGTVFLTSNTWTTINSANGLQRLPGTLNWTGGTTQNYARGSLMTNLNASFQDGTAAGSIASVEVYGNSTAMTTIDHTFKVPAGTVIVGSGSASYVIEIIKI